MKHPDQIPAYENRSLGNILKDIVQKSNDKTKKIDMVVNQLSDLMSTNKGDMSIVAFIKDYLELGLKNDEKLVKVANVLQRLASSPSLHGEGMGGSANELGGINKEELRKVAQELRQEDGEYAELSQNLESDLEVKLDMSEDDELQD